MNLTECVAASENELPTERGNGICRDALYVAHVSGGESVFSSASGCGEGIHTFSIRATTTCLIK